MAEKPDVFLMDDGVRIEGGGGSPEVDIAGGNHWDLAESDGDLRIGDDENKLKMGVALGGAGAGNARIWASSELKLGASGRSVVTVDGGGVRLGSRSVLETRGDVSILGDSTLEVEGNALFTGQIAVGGDFIGNLEPAASGSYDVGIAGARWDTLYVNNVNKASDRRLKTDVETLDGGLDAVEDLRPVSYTRRDDGGETHLGLIGQEVAEVLPEVVDRPDDGDGYLGLDYTELVAVLVDAVQDHRAETGALEDRVEDQAERIERQDDRIEAQRDRIETQQEQLDAQAERIEDLEARLAALEAAG